MSSEAVQYQIVGSDAASVARSIERGVIRGHLEPGSAVPSVRGLARELGLSPTTVAAAYRDLKLRGILVAHDRSRTTVSHRPALSTRIAPELPEGARDLATGNPDADLLPDLSAMLEHLTIPPRRYADEPGLPDLLALASTAFDEDGIDSSHLAVVGGGLDGVERLLEVHTRVGDRVIVEDPCYIGTIDLVRMLGLEPVPVLVDDRGCVPEALDEALDASVRAAIITPRAQNPTGAAWDAERAAAIAAAIARHPEMMAIEIDAAGPVSGADYHHATRGLPHWAVVRSLSKSLGPDLRVATIAGDGDTLVRLLGRQRLGTGWISYVLQRLTATAWHRARDQGLLATAARHYQARRQALLDALADRDIVAHGRSGFNVWVPVAEEVPVVQGLAARGWAVQAGEPFRIRTDAAVRITVAELGEHEAAVLADELAEVLDQRLGTRRG